MPASAAHVFLVPGFFGFANLGEIRYFGHVRRVLLAAAQHAGRVPHVHVVRTHPTASLVVRARQLYEAIAAATTPQHRVVVIGHSSGGLDARVLLAPGVNLGISPRLVERVARRVDAVVGVAVPYHGTPLATVFGGALGAQLLQMLSLATLYALRFGKLPLAMLLPFGAAMAQLDRRFGLGTRLLDQLFSQLLADFTAGRRRAIERFFRAVRSDQALLHQLTPAAAALLQATTTMRPGVRYGCVVTCARRPGLRTTVAAGVDASAQATHAIFMALGRLARLDADAHLPPLTAPQARALKRAFGWIPGRRHNDGIVPTRSQVWGRVVAAVRADHLDVLGHFDDPEHAPPHFDWLCSGAGFARRDFEQTWRRVRRFAALA
jgi:triacylglycerol lipase